MKTIEQYTSSNYSEASLHRDRIRADAAAILGGSAETALAMLKKRTAVLTLLAGSGSRWVKSIEAAENDEDAVNFDVSKPRGLFPVRNLLPETICNKKKLPVAAYSLYAVQGLGSHLIMTSGYEQEIEAEILEPLGFDSDSYQFQRQELFLGSPLGHGAAALQAADFWKDYDYVICNFGGDANNRNTISDSLLLLAALDSTGNNTGLLLPAAMVQKPAYTIETNDQGLPLAFHHAKLTGKTTSEEKGWSNVGVRLYRSRDLLESLYQLHEAYWSDDSGYAVPGNQGNELALDNVDAVLAAQHKARLFTIAEAGEITPAKTLDAIPAFLSAVQRLPGMRKL
ncbi:hypothetical protein [Spirochaeta dissipatitropha]